MGEWMNGCFTLLYYMYNFNGYLLLQSIILLFLLSLAPIVEDLGCFYIMIIILVIDNVYCMPTICRHFK